MLLAGEWTLGRQVWSEARHPIAVQLSVRERQAQPPYPQTRWRAHDLQSVCRRLTQARWVPRLLTLEGRRQQVPAIQVRAFLAHARCLPVHAPYPIQAMASQQGSKVQRRPAARRHLVPQVWGPLWAVPQGRAAVRAVPLCAARVPLH